MDQFTYAERATDWRANNNIAESIFKQMSEEPHPIPEWLVCGAGTGGTSATLGRYVRYRRHCTRILCADPQTSVFYDYYLSVLDKKAQPDLSLAGSSRIEGIGRPRVESSFIPGCIDAMVKVPDALSLAAMRYVTSRLGRRVGGSTGTNFIGVLSVAQRMQEAGMHGSIVTILCDSGERYSHSYYNPQWYAKHEINVAGADTALNAALMGEPLTDVKTVWSRGGCG
jgi:cysteine synthase